MKKYILITFIVLIIIAIVFIISNVNKSDNNQINKNKLTLNEASKNIIQKELKKQKMPVFQDIKNGNWENVKKEINNNKENRIWILNKTTNVFIDNPNTFKNTSINDYANYLWDKYKKEKKLKNIYIQNLAKLIQKYNSELLNLQEKLNKEYFSINNVTNTKIVLLEACIYFYNDKAKEIFRDAISSGKSNLVITAIRSVKDFKDKYIEKQLIKLSKSKNKSIKATSFKILAIHTSPHAEKNITKLLESKNAHFVEAGIFIIKEMNLAKKYQDIIMKNLNKMDYFNKLKAQKLIEHIK